MAIAAFDFDGTLARGDAVVPFLHATAGALRTAYALVLLPFPTPTLARDVCKARLLARAFAKPISADIFAQRCAVFADTLVAHQLFPDVLARLRWHQERGDVTCLVSASLDAYLVRVGELLHVDHVLCTQLERRADGTPTGRIAGANVRAEEKVRLLETHVLTKLTNASNASGGLWAYGNSESGDGAMLARADHAFWVGKSGAITTA